jgi:hypothetical protein
VVTQKPQPTSVDEALNPWAWGEELPAAGGLFHLPNSLACAYGPFTAYDLTSAAGLIRYTIDFVNRPQTMLTSEQLLAGPVQLPRGRERLRQLLRAAARGAQAGDPDLVNPSAEWLTDIRQRARGIQWRSRLERTPTGVEWRHHAFIEDADAFYSLVATLLMSEENRREFGQCRYCDAFFVVEKRAQHEGRPERLYCKREHRTAAHAEGGAGRQRDRRTRQRAVQILVKSGLGLASSRMAVAEAFKNHPGTTPEQLADRARALVKGARKHK